MGKQKYDSPGEIEIIKRFINDKFASSCEVKVGNDQIVIGVSSAALAGSLRTHLHELQAQCKTDKRLLIRIV